jgi:hypothetical protein
MGFRKPADDEFLGLFFADSGRPFNPAVFHVEQGRCCREKGSGPIQRSRNNLAPKALNRAHQSAYRFPIQLCRRIIQQK